MPRFTDVDLHEIAFSLSTAIKKAAELRDPRKDLEDQNGEYKGMYKGMTHEEFQTVLEQQLDRVRAQLGIKTEEYASREDQLHNFRQAAHLQEIGIAQAVLGMMSKHTVSIYDMVKSGKPFPTTVWDEKLTDHLVYLILIKASLVDTANERSWKDTFKIEPTDSAPEVLKSRPDEDIL